ncbi:hypothetical protein RHMOL_Rhmol01G0208700 [Rhododendron molle]|uniref:Uncharacterized protein n=1 Tax=Rhododendron molle TaxID=49168 RepID=A0ACC0Q3L2_RHOML|nr:hypothetical protein RHMOL_Rhmol01G0208700 [Rhododendron molle]
MVGPQPVSCLISLLRLSLIFLVDPSQIKGVGLGLSLKIEKTCSCLQERNGSTFSDCQARSASTPTLFCFAFRLVFNPELRKAALRIRPFNNRGLFSSQGLRIFRVFLSMKAKPSHSKKKWLKRLQDNQGRGHSRRYADNQGRGHSRRKAKVMYSQLEIILLVGLLNVLCIIDQKGPQQLCSGWVSLHTHTQFQLLCLRSWMLRLVHPGHSVVKRCSVVSREDAKEMQLHDLMVEKLPVMVNVPENIKRRNSFHIREQLFSCLIVPLEQANFYVTESEHGKPKFSEEKAQGEAVNLS